MEPTHSSSRHYSSADSDSEAKIDGVDTRAGCNPIIILGCQIRAVLMSSIGMRAASTCTVVLEATADVMETPRHYSGVYEVLRTLTARNLVRLLELSRILVNTTC